MNSDQSWQLLIVVGCIAIAIGNIVGCIIGYRKLLSATSGIEHRILSSAAKAEKFNEDKTIRRGRGRGRNRRRGRRGRNRKRRHS